MHRRRQRTIPIAFVFAGAAAVAAWLVVRACSTTTRRRPVDSPAEPQAALTPAPTHTLRMPLPDPLIDPAIVVSKHARILTLFSAGEAVRRYPVVLGSAPEGDKEREGDGRTPLGEFYVCTRNEASRHVRALGLSYPSREHADRGLAAGAISRRDHRAIIDALRHYRRPPWHTPLGGEIMLHGGGTGRGDWTQGCVALDDEDALELFERVPLGTPVSIEE